mmetsp:Transcript_14869/g.35031  ORF Transcript_14869/g.35031 Transcript_14869/m.35031 type:complete len:228 (+) Transcript_14869:477-1160(+)
MRPEPGVRAPRQEAGRQADVAIPQEGPGQRGGPQGARLHCQMVRGRKGGFPRALPSRRAKLGRACESHPNQERDPDQELLPKLQGKAQSGLGEVCLGEVWRQGPLAVAAFKAIQGEGESSVRVQPAISEPLALPVASNRCGVQSRRDDRDRPRASGLARAQRSSPHSADGWPRCHLGPPPRIRGKPLLRHADGPRSGRLPVRSQQLRSKQLRARRRPQLRSKQLRPE